MPPESAYQARIELLKATDARLREVTTYLPSFVFNEDHLRPAMQWFEKISDARLWNLSLQERCNLLGKITEQEYATLMTLNTQPHESQMHSSDVLARLTLLWKISNLLTSLVGRSRDIECFSRINTSPIFKSKSIKEYLLTNSDIERFRIVEKYLLAAVFH